VITTNKKIENFIENDDEWFSGIELKVLDLEKELTEWRESRTREPGPGSEAYRSPPRRDREMLRAIRYTLSTTKGRLLILSSPNAQYGAFYSLHQEWWANEKATTLIWKATSPEMNPTLSPETLARQQQEDPEGYRSEVLAEFRSARSALFELRPDSRVRTVAPVSCSRRPTPAPIIPCAITPTTAIAYLQGETIGLQGIGRAARWEVT